MNKLILYIFCFPLVIWACDSINFNGMFKKNKQYQARVFYIMVVFIITYLVVSFLSDLLLS